MPARSDKRLGPMAVALLVLGLGALAPATAEAQIAPMAGYYLRADAGASISAGASGDILSGSGFGQDFGTSAIIGGGIGYAMPVSPDMPVRFRFDLTGSDRIDYDANHSASNSVITLTGKTSLNSAVFLGSVYADIPTGSAFTPYLGVGIGMAINDLDQVHYVANGVAAGTEGGSTQTNFAWSIGAGVAWQVTNALAIDGGYRYLDAGRVSTNGAVQIPVSAITIHQPPVHSDLHAHELTIGVRWGF
jgi:opacity protein-like surface antigen